MESKLARDARQALIAATQRLTPQERLQAFLRHCRLMMSRPGLDLKVRELLLIAACTTLGFATPQLRAHIEAALGVGATHEEIVQTILQMTFYAGGPATSNALSLAAETFADVRQ